MQKRPPEYTGERRWFCSSFSCRHLDGVISQVRIGLCVFFQLGFEVNTGVGELKGAAFTRDVSLDVNHTWDFGQIASDRGGTTSSVHVGHFEADKGRLPGAANQT